MESPILDAFGFAVELSKQLITLATGTIALTITFTREFSERTSADVRTLGISWLFYLGSITCGIWHMMALTGTLAASPVPSLEGLNVRLPAALQIFLFLGGTALITVYGLRMINRTVKPVEQSSIDGSGATIEENPEF